MKTVLIILFILLALNLSVMAELDEKTVTYGNFMSVRHVASSISHVYFATSEGITRYNKLEQRWEEPLTSSEGIDHTDIHRIYVDEFDSKLYVVTSFGKNEYDLLFNSWYSISEIPQLDLNYRHVSLPGIMYPPSGFNYSPDGFFYDTYNREIQISDIIDDRSGDTWIGTRGYGAATGSVSSAMIEFLPYGLLQNRVDAIYNDDGRLWLSGHSYNNYRSGISIFDPEENSFEYIESGLDPFFPEDDIYCFEADDKYIYTGTGSGLFVIDKEELSVKNQLTLKNGLPDDIVMALKRMGDSLFIGTARGLAMLNLKTDSIRVIRAEQFINQDIYDFELTDSSLWIAASNGAYQLHFGNGKLQKFQDPKMMIYNRAFSVERFEDEIWFGSDGGFVKLNLTTGKTYTFTSITSGISNKALAVNDKIAAVPSDRGMTLIFHSDPKFPSEREFTTDDGLPSNYIRSLEIDGDFLWIGSDKGLTRFLWNNPQRVD